MKLKIGLNTKDIDYAISELDKYKADLPRKTAQLRQDIASLVRTAAEQGFASADYNYIKGQGFEGVQIFVYVRNQHNASIVFTNQLEAIFIEFGAGVYFNGPAGTSNHPSAAKHAFYIGSYGHGYGKYDEWSFQDKNGNYVTTYGTPGSAPLYNALKFIVDGGFIQSVAAQIF